MLQYKKIIIGLLLPLAAVFYYLAGCDPVQRYKVLTFFFDGVPPLGGPQVGLIFEPNEPSLTDDSKSKSTVSRHKPYGDCDNCHTQQPKTGRPILQEPPPQLCYRCHTNYAAAQKYVHGPVAYGACLFCHNPHGSKFLKLQKAPQPDLCYQCHDQNDIEAISAHQSVPIENCTRCHDPHVGFTRTLLKMY